MPVWHRVIVFAGSVMLMETTLKWDLVGLVLVSGVGLIEYYAGRKSKPHLVPGQP